MTYFVRYVRSWTNSHGVLCEEFKEVGRAWKPRDSDEDGFDCELDVMPPPETKLVWVDGEQVALTPKWRVQIRRRKTKEPEVFVKR